LWERVRVRGTSHYMSIPEVKNEKLINDILKLKEQRKAIILAHNYQLGEVQDIADFVGDSLDLSQRAARTEAEVIVFCGVHFMAETAKILSPDKTVLMPDINAGCAMANMITLRQLKEMKKKHPEAVVVSYINTTAEIKAESDYCCTSANAVKVVQTIPREKEILFIPDKYLGDYVSRQANRKMILWEGYCPTHRRILAEDILKKKAQYPKAEVLVHPECTPDVIAMADKVLSTSGICRYAKESNSEEFIIGTEIGILHRLKKENPNKKFYPASILSDCPNMKLTNLEKILWSLEDMIYKVEVPPDIAQRAKRSIDRMLEIV
jgi:quinolinate synthase